jgi:hypothetical protein
MTRFMIKCIGVGVLFVGLGGMVINGLTLTNLILDAVGIAFIIIGRDAPDGD